MAATPAARTATAPLELVHSTARPDQARRHELAAFLRSRRERISPDQVGLPSGGRRRTPGLRREEVAQLAAIGVTWYTWLEQARDIQVSVQVLDAIARGLLLNAGEREHLFVLAGATDPTPAKVCPVVTPALRALLDQLDPMPACVINPRYDLIAYNNAYRRLVIDLDDVPLEDRNLMWLAFTNPAWRVALLDWEQAARAMVGRFRAAMADHVAEPPYKTLLKKLLLASPEFTELWERHDVAVTGDGQKRFLNARVGLLNFDFTNLWLGPRPGYRMIGYAPADLETRARVARLATGAAAPAGQGSTA
ncbi:helix-turn-helix transcriptional regulator [Kitasatospora sp. LaBMicrA B282]|uniref:helix-turn-helix transcriptional regulator n=1 Tax=Kitasatospora sp. LaBMicrA B282 TaxID=3420949 RepID=UPI003D1390D6